MNSFFLYTPIPAGFTDRVEKSAPIAPKAPAILEYLAVPQKPIIEYLKAPTSF